MERLKRHERHEGIYVDYSDTDADTMFRQEMERESYFQSRFGNGTKLFQFDTTTYPMREAVVRRLIEAGQLSAPVELEELHREMAPEDLSMDWSGHNAASQIFFEPGDDFEQVYRRLVKEIIADRILNEPVYFQTLPTFRFSFPGSPGYTWRPNFHSDIALGHPPREINVWLPLSACQATNGLIYAELDDSLAVWKRFDLSFARFHDALDNDDTLYAHCEEITKPLDCGYGDVFMFDSRCMHLSQVNRSNQTRVSIDFRVLPTSEFKRNEVVYVGTGRSRSRFEPGGYYDPRSTAEL